MKKSVLAIALAVLMTVSLLTVGAMADGTGSGTAADPYTTVDAYNKGIANGAKDGQDVYLTINGGNFTEGQFKLSNVQSSVNPPKLHLKITGATFTGNTAGDGTNSSFMYLPNCQELVIRNCTFDTGSTVLTYGINWNLIQIDGATVDISDCSFKGTYVENVIKLNQRNGEGDDADDVNFEGSFPATIAEAKISNIDIDSPVAVILLGSAAKGENGEAAPSTGAFPVTISNVTTTSRHGVVVFQAYLADSDAETAAKNALESGNLSGVSDYVKVMQAGDTLTKTANGDLGKAGDFVASIGSDYYTSLQSAIDAAEDGSEIVLLKSVSYGERIDVRNSVTLNLNTNTFSSTNTNAMLVYPNKVLRLKNGNLVNTVGNGVFVYKDGTVYVENDVTINTEGSGVTGTNNKGDVGNAKMYIYGTIISNYIAVFVQGPCNTVVIDGAHIESNYWTLYQNGSYGGSTFNIENSTLEDKSEGGAGIYISNSLKNSNDSAQGMQTLTIINSIIKGNTAVEVKFTDVNISGENTELIATGEVQEPHLNNNGSVTAGYALAITHNGTATSMDASKGEISISAGKFVGPVAIQDPSDSKETLADMKVSGGTFSNSVAQYVTDDLNYELNNNGTYSYYATAEEALANAEPGAEINGLGAAATTNYTITVVYGNGMYPSEYTVPAGTEYTLPTPSKPGYIFLGWRCDGVTYNAEETVKVTGNMTFTAVWGNLPDVKPSEPDTPDTPVFPFHDVTARDWFYDAVKYVYEKGLMDGVDAGVFAPNDTLTRAMVWTIIARAEGVDTTGGATWYAKAQEYVTAKGISDGENPNAPITRQELVTMLYRLAGEPAVSGTITAPDASSVSSWAQNAMTWAMNIGLVEGDENGAVTPTATATRAQAAALIMRYLEA